MRSDSVPADRVATQRPQPRQEAEEGSTVTIIVSSGPGDATIPFVRGSPRAQAERRLKAAGFRVDVRREFNDEVPANRVIETSPSERSRLERGRTVTLVVSRGPRMVEVPDVVGKDRDEAERMLEARGLQVSLHRSRGRGEGARHGARRCRRRRAARAEKGATVTLTVAKEPEQVEIPDVLGEQADDAARRRRGGRASASAGASSRVDAPDGRRRRARARPRRRGRSATRARG